MDDFILEFERAAIKVSWESLDHAGGSAEDTPSMLRSLWAGRTDTAAPYMHLWSGLLGESRLWSATAPAAYLLSILVRDGRFGGDDKTLRESVFVFFRELALRRRSEQTPRSPVSSIVDLVTPAPETACGLVIPTLLEVELSFVDDSDTRLASCAATAAVAAVTTSQGSFPSQRRTLIKSLKARVQSTGSSADRTGALLDLGRLGESLSGFLSSQERVIRLAAALGSADLSNQRALDVLLDAAHRPGELDTLLSPPGDSNWMTLPQLGGRPLSVVVAEEICARVKDLSLLVQPLVSATRSIGGPIGRLVARPYYRKLFPAGLPPVGIASRPQREVAHFLASSDEVWGQASLQRLLADLKLPVSRDEWERL